MINTLLRQEKIQNSINESIELIVNCFKKKGKLLICGNGGSAADALHIVGELRKKFLINHPLEKKFTQKLKKLFPNDLEFIQNNLQNAVPVISLVNEISLMTAINNDSYPDLMFAQQLIGLGTKNDILLAISTSGKSNNIIYAVKIAKCLDMKVVALTGKNNNLLSELADITIHAPSIITYQIQEYHLMLYHYLCKEIEKQLYSL